MFEYFPYLTPENIREFNEKPQGNISVSEKTKTIIKRRYDGAGRNRLTDDWKATSLPSNAILRVDLRTLRNRSRDLCRNNVYAKKALRLYRNNVVGTGFTLQIRPNGETDTKLSKKIEDAWREWCKKQFCTTSGKMSFLQASQMAIEHTCRDGEFLIRKVYDKKNKFGCSIKFYSGAWLDENYNADLPNGNRVLMSVEVDKMDRVVAFWLTEPPGNFPSRDRNFQRKRYDASEFIHGYLPSEDEEQTRGVPWFHATMLRLKTFDRFENFEAVAKAVNASQMGFIIPPEDAQYNAKKEDEENEEIELIQDAEAGIFVELPPNYDFKTFEPKADTTAPDFKKTALRGAAAGADVSYHSLAGDLEAVNYSSAKIGGLEERDNYTILQEFMIENFCEPIFAFWLETAFLNGVLNINQKQYEKVKTPIFRGRGWTWVEPLKEASAAVVSLENNLTTLTSVLAEKGIDIEDHFTEIQREKELAQKFGIDLVYGKQSVDLSKLDSQDNSQPANDKKK